MTTLFRAPTANRWPRFHVMGSSNYFDDLFSDEFDSQGFLHAPTPGVFGRTDSESSFHEYRSTLSPVQHEVPRASTPCLRPRPRTEKLALLRLSEWDPNKVYDDFPPTCLRVTIGWKVALNGKPFAEDTDQDVALTLASYWQLVLEPKIEKEAAKKRILKPNMILQNTKVTVSVMQRSERDLVKTYDGTAVVWATIETQLDKWSDLFSAGKELRVDVLVKYDDREVAGRQSTAAKRVDKRSTGSNTQQMLTDLHSEQAEQEASGIKAPDYVRLYNLFTCPSLSCNSPNYCWVDHEFGNVHRKMSTHLLGKIIDHDFKVDTVKTHRDVPEDLQTKIRMEDQQRHDRKRKAEASSPSELPRVHITNVMPGQSEKDGVSASHPQTVSALDIPGFRDDAVEDYVRFLQGKVRSRTRRDQYLKIGNVILDRLFDLEQVHRKLTPEFFMEEDVNIKEGPAEQFIRDIPAFAQFQRESVANSGAQID